MSGEERKSDPFGGQDLGDSEPWSPKPPRRHHSYSRSRSRRSSNGSSGNNEGGEPRRGARRSASSRSLNTSSSSLTNSPGTSPRRGGLGRKASSRRLIRKGKRKEVEKETQAQEDLNKKLASLQLPHMPPQFLSATSMTTESLGMNSQYRESSSSTYQPPTIRILVVADIDLESASALAESALTGSPQSPAMMIDGVNPLQTVDLCIACGPFCQEDDLRNYYQGRQRRRHFTRHTNTSSGWASHSAAPIWNRRGGGTHTNSILPLPLPPAPTTSPSSSYHPYSYHKTESSTSTNKSYPIRRTKEETAAMEGLMTAALSQLESIVCRVVFVPGKPDPITTITSNSMTVDYTKERRLTPNSRNIHQHWMPLTPGLGCAGLLFLEGRRLLQQPPPLEDDDDVDDDDDDSETSSLEPQNTKYNHHDNNNNNHSFSYQDATNPQFESHNGSPPSAPPPLTSAAYVERAKEYGTDFCSQLRKLVDLAPHADKLSDSEPTHPQSTSLQDTNRFQSILVTQFNHLEKDLLLDGSSSGGFPGMGPSSSRHNSKHGTHPHSAYEEEHMTVVSGASDDLYLGNMSEDEEESFDPPWPIEHEAFCAESFVQEHVLLEIAAGKNSKGQTVRPMVLPKGPSMKVIMPGSLREKGEFCLVDVAFTKSPFGAASGKNDYRWRVRRTRFQTLNDYV